MLYVFCVLVFGKARATIQIQHALAKPCFLPASALYPALPHQSNKSKMHRHKDKIHAMFCVHVLFCKAYASTDWAKRIGTVMFYCMPQLYKCISPPKQERTECTGTLSRLYFLFFFWQSAVITQAKHIGAALFSTSLSFISCLASPKQQKQNAQAQRQNPCNVLCTCSFL